jgi:biotin carboxylase
MESSATQPAAVLRAATAAGHQVSWLVHDLAPYKLRAAGLPAGVTAVTGIDTSDPDQAVAAASTIHRTLPVDGCLTTSEGHLPAMAAIATVLGLRHEPPERIALMRNKAAVRTALTGSSVPQPAWRLVAAPDELAAALEATGLPAVIKPVDGSGSIGVTVVQDLAAARPALEDVLGRTSYGRNLRSAGQALVEQFIPGELVSVEAFSRDGRHVPLALNRKRVGGLTAAVELGGTLLPAPDGQVAGSGYAAAVTAATDALTALGFRDGATHIELIVGADGPWLVEVGPRIGGGPVPAALDLMLDRPVFAALIDLHLEGPWLPPRPVAAAAVGALIAPTAGKLAVFTPTAPLASGDADIVLAESAVGDLVRPPRSNRDRLGFVGCRGDSPEQAEERLNRALSRVRIEVSEVAAPPGEAARSTTALDGAETSAA